jgi:hypothetical protein
MLPLRPSSTVLSHVNQTWPPPPQLYNLNNPLRARSYWKTGVIMGIVHGVAIFLIVYYSAVRLPAPSAAHAVCVVYHHVSGGPGATSTQSMDQLQHHRCLKQVIFLTCRCACMWLAGGLCCQNQRSN